MDLAEEFALHAVEVIAVEIGERPLVVGVQKDARLEPREAERQIGFPEGTGRRRHRGAEGLIERQHGLVAVEIPGSECRRVITGGCRSRRRLTMDGEVRQVLSFGWPEKLKASNVL